MPKNPADEHTGRQKVRLATKEWFQTIGFLDVGRRCRLADWVMQRGKLRGDDVRKRNTQGINQKGGFGPMEQDHRVGWRWKRHIDSDTIQKPVIYPIYRRNPFSSLSGEIHAKTCAVKTGTRGAPILPFHERLN
jgi:hypothetical protein